MDEWLACVRQAQAVGEKSRHLANKHKKLAPASIAMAIRAHRMRRGWSAAYTSRQARMAQDGVARLERGDRRLTFDIAAHLAALFDSTLEELMAEGAALEAQQKETP